MFSAVKVVAALLRPVSAACRPLIQRVQKYWDVDHCAANFYTDEEYKVIREKEKEAWAAYHKDKFFSHVRTNVIPSIRVDLSADKLVTFTPRADGGLLKKNPDAFHAFVGGTMVLYVLAIALTLQLLATFYPPPSKDAKSTNRTLMSKRVAILEQELGINRSAGAGGSDADATQAPGAVLAPPTTSGVGGRLAAKLEVEKLEAELKQRRQQSQSVVEASVKARSLASLQPTAAAALPDALASLEERLRAVEEALATTPRNPEIAPHESGNRGGDDNEAPVLIRADSESVTASGAPDRPAHD